MPEYLPVGAIESWVQSILALPDRYYRHQAQFILWLVATLPVLIGTMHKPGILKKQHGINFQWSLSHSIALRLGGDDDSNYPTATFLPPENIKAFCDSVKRHFTSRTLDNWIGGIRQSAYYDWVSELALLLFDNNGRFTYYGDV